MSTPDAIELGTRLMATTAQGSEVRMVAVSRPEGRNLGHSFPVVWVLTEEASAAGRFDERIPWPIESVRVVSHVDT